MSNQIVDTFDLNPKFPWLSEEVSSLKDFPTTRSEDWKYFSLRKLSGQKYMPAVNPEGFDLLNYSKLGLKSVKPKLVFMNGVFLGTSNFPDSLRWTPFSKTSKQQQVDIAEMQKQKSFSCNLQSVLTSDGVFLEVESAVGAVEVLNICSSANESCYSAPVIAIKASKGADLTLCESKISTDEGEASEVVRTSFGKLLCSVEQDATLRLVRMLEESSNTIDLLSFEGHVDGTLNVVQLDWSAGDSRVDAEVALTSEEAVVSFDGLIYADKDQKKDHRTKLIHAAKSTFSHQLYKTLVDDKSTASFGGCIHILANCSKSEADQLSQNMLLSENATANSQPQLKIDNEDVKCSHGATYSQPSNEQVFYLKSRGIDEQRAKAMLCLAFAEEVMIGNEGRGFPADITKEICQKIREKLNS